MHCVQAHGHLLFILAELLDHIQIHKDKVADAPSHHKQMKNLMGAKMPMFRIEDLQFESIDDTAYGVDDTACQKPQECTEGQSAPQSAEYAEAYPSHGDIDEGRKPLRAGDPADIDDHADESDSPYDGKQCVAKFVAQNDEADRCVGTGDQDKDHHVIQLAKYLQNIIFYCDTVIEGAGSIECDHASNKYRHGDKSGRVGADSGLHQQRRRRDQSHHHADEVSDSASGFTNGNLHSKTSCISFLFAYNRIHNFYM